jgi:hypothetical protein
MQVEKGKPNEKLLTQVRTPSASDATKRAPFTLRPLFLYLNIYTLGPEHKMFLPAQTTNKHAVLATTPTIPLT